MLHRTHGALKAALLAATVIAGAAPAFAQAEKVRIGLVSPNTGANARYGGFAQRGAQLAAKEINEAGGVAGKSVELVPADSQCAPAEGVSATRRLISQEKVGMIIGDICSSVTLAMQPVVEADKVLLVNAASSNPDITYKAGVGGYKWTYRNYPTDEVRAAVVLKAAARKGYRKYAVLSVDSDYGRGAINFTRKYLSENGAEIVSEDYYKDGETDFRPVLAKIRRAGVDAILMYGLVDTSPIVARQMLESGLAGKVKLVGNGEFNAASTIRSAPAVFNGAVEAAAWLPAWDSPKSKAFVEKYRATYGGEEPNNHAYVHWETTHLLAQAIKQAGSAEPDAVRSTLSAINYDSAVGPVTFDDHNQARLPMIVISIQDGKPTIEGAERADIQYPKTN